MLEIFPTLHLHPRLSVSLEHLHQVPVLPPHLNLKEANSEGGKALVDRVVVFVLSSPVLLMFLQWLGMEPSSRENLYRSLFLNQLDYYETTFLYLHVKKFTNLMARDTLYLYFPCTRPSKSKSLNIHPSTSAKNN